MVNKSKSVEAAIKKQKEVDIQAAQDRILDKTEKDVVIDPFKAEITAFIEGFRSTLHEEWKSSIKAYTMDKTDRWLRLLEQNRSEDSNVYTPFVKNLVDKTFNRLYDTEIDFVVQSMKKDMRRGERHIKTLMQNGFVNAENRNNFFCGVKSQIITGNGFGKASIVSNGDDFELKIDHIPVFNLFFNINMDFYNSGLPIIERGIKSRDQILSETMWLVSPSAQLINDTFTSPKAFSNRDDSRIWDMWVRHNDISQRITTEQDLKGFDEDKLYQIEKYGNSSSEIIWRYTNDTILLYVNGVKWYDGPNPLGMHPYFNLMYDPSYGRNISRGIASTHLDGQYTINALHNKAMDDIRLSGINMWVITGAGDIEGFERSEKMYPENGMVLRLPQGTDLRRFDEFKPMDAASLNAIKDIITTGENEVGLNSLTGGQAGSKERSSFAAQTLVNTTQLNVKPAVEGMSLGLTRIAKIRQKLLVRHFEDRDLTDTKIEVRTYDNKFEKLDIKYLKGEYNIIFSNKSLVSLNNMQAVTDKINAINALNPLAVDKNSGRGLINQEYLIKSIFQELGYDEQMYLSEDDYDKELFDMEDRRMDREMKLYDKQIALEKKKQELAGVMNPQQVPTQVANGQDSSTSIPLGGGGVANLSSL